MSILEPPALASLFGLIHFETIVYLIGTTVFFVAMMKEQSELRQRQDAETDALTGLPNRRAFLAVAERLAARSRRDRRPLAVAAFDLDRFKQVNDTYGHALGDRTLQVFAEVARESLRPGDLVSRIGGEEFAAVFPGADREVAYLMSERIRRAFAVAALAVNGRELGATVSAGVAVAVDAETLAEVMERADAALYRAKLNGRDRVECDGGPPRAYPRLVEVA
jgi:diguanylate cyclase (GGDEF)-like protein